MTWDEARIYCNNYRSGGYANWRMPTFAELITLYDANKTNPQLIIDLDLFTDYIYTVTSLINFSGCVYWTSYASGDKVAIFFFTNGEWYRTNRYAGSDNYVTVARVLPVRSAR